MKFNFGPSTLGSRLYEGIECFATRVYGGLKAWSVWSKRKDLSGFVSWELQA